MYPLVTLKVRTIGCVDSTPEIAWMQDHSTLSSNLSRPIHARHRADHLPYSAHITAPGYLTKLARKCINYINRTWKCRVVFRSLSQFLACTFMNWIPVPSIMALGHRGLQSPSAKKINEFCTVLSLANSLSILLYLSIGQSDIVREHGVPAYRVTPWWFYTRLC